jgi:tryptophanyl-tRNA synthetase
MSDDEKFYFKDEGQTLEHYCRLSRENARDIIARGFNPAKTYIFSNTDEVGGELQKNVIRMMRATRGSTIKGIFGLTSENSNIGQLAWPIYQSVPAYSTSFPFLFGSRNVPCLVPMAIDQDPYFRLARDFVQTGPGRGLLKPPVIHSEFLVGLGGINDKMSSSAGGASSLFLTDSAKTIRDKITKFAFSGGGATLKEHREHGATLEVDVPYQYLLYFLEDDAELARVAKAYSTGEMKTSEIKELMITVVTAFVMEHQKRRSEVTDDVLQHYFSSERDFDHGRVPLAEHIELLADEQYETMGINFDRYFGCAKQ